MPCSDGGPSYPSYSEIDDMKKRLDNVTRMLCELTAAVPPEYIQNVDGLKTWARRHAEEDQRRRDEEELARTRKKADLKRKIAAAKKELDDLE